MGSKCCQYRQRGRWFRSRPNDPIFRGAYQLADPSNCFSYAVAMGPRITSANINCAVVEHVPELQTVPDFVEDSSSGQLPSDKLPEHQLPAVGPEYTRLSQRFIMDGLGNPILTNPPHMLGGKESDVPIRRMMNAVGSTRNDAGFVLFDAKLNLYKKLVCPARRPLSPKMIADRDELWVTKNPVVDKRMDALIKNDDYVTAINKVRGALAVIAYLNNPTVNGILSSQFNEVGRELDRANLTWMAQGNGDEHAQRVWSYWVKDHLTTMGLHTHNWVSRWTSAMERNWGARSGTVVKQMVEAARKLKDADTTINQDDVD